MGAFIANFHVRSSRTDAVRNVVAAMVAGEFRISNAQSGWISIYEERASTQDEDWIEQFAKDLSGRLETACVAFLVHDSDIARYWLCEEGQLLDQYNSFPDYFDSVSAAERRQLAGQSSVFLRYCRPQVTLDQVEAVLRTQQTFAEETVRQLADFLGIDPDRALEDFCDMGDGGSWFPDGTLADDFDDDDGGEESDSGAHIGRSSQVRMMRLMQEHAATLTAMTKDTGTSPQSDALVLAAAAGNLTEIDRLVEDGANVDAPGLLQIEPIGGASMVPTGVPLPQVAAPPLIAAASKGQASAIRRLVELGANAAQLHPILGSALHIAAQRGAPEAVETLLAAGVPADLKNMQGQTARAIVQAVRSQVEATKNLVKSMPQLQGVYNTFLAKLSEVKLPESGWDACDALLREAGG
jgi:hypothetical protein